VKADSLDTLADMTLLGHLAELRRRLAWSMAGVVVGTCGAYSFSGKLFSLLTAPYISACSTLAAEPDLIGTGPAEAFILKLQAALFAGVILAAPLILYQLWRFVAPGLYPSEKHRLLPFLAASLMLLCAGLAFCYFFVLPLAFRFFTEEYTSIGVKPVIRIGEYFSFILRLLSAFALVFELPVLTFFLARIGAISHIQLLRWSRPALVGIFILAAILTPPDIVSQLLLAMPLMLLYGLSILIAKLAYPTKNRSANFAG